VPLPPGSWNPQRFRRPLAPGDTCRAGEGPHLVLGQLPRTPTSPRAPRREWNSAGGNCPPTLWWCSAGRSSRPNLGGGAGITIVRADQRTMNDALRSCVIPVADRWFRAANHRGDGRASRPRLATEPPWFPAKCAPSDPSARFDPISVPLSGSTGHWVAAGSYRPKVALVSAPDFMPKDRAMHIWQGVVVGPRE
jgi:hypothetical protein